MIQIGTLSWRVLQASRKARVARERADGRTRQQVTERTKREETRFGRERLNPRGVAQSVEGESYE